MFVLIQQELIKATKHDMYANEYSAYMKMHPSVYNAMTADLQT